MRRATLLAFTCSLVLSGLSCLAADAPIISIPTLDAASPQKMTVPVTGFPNGACRVILELQTDSAKPATVNLPGTITSNSVAVTLPTTTALLKDSKYRLTVRSKVAGGPVVSVKLVATGSPIKFEVDTSAPAERPTTLNVTSSVAVVQQGVSAGDSGLDFGIRQFVIATATNLRVRFQTADSDRTDSATLLSNLFGKVANDAKGAMDNANGNMAVSAAAADGFRKELRSGIDAVYAKRIGAKTDWFPVLVEMENRINQIAETPGTTRPSDYAGPKLKLDQIDHLAVLFSEIHEAFAQIAKDEDQFIRDLAKVRAQQIVAGAGTGSSSSSSFSSLSRTGCKTCRKRCGGCWMLLLGP